MYFTSSSLHGALTDEQRHRHSLGRLWQIRASGRPLVCCWLRRVEMKVRDLFSHCLSLVLFFFSRYYLRRLPES